MTQHGQFFGRCCSYPQGHLSIIPQILSLAALFAVFHALPWNPWFESTYPYFMCARTDSSSYNCFPLYLTSEEYWGTYSDDIKFWPIQLATLFAILAVTAGSIAFLILLSATCFPIGFKTLIVIAMTYLACGLASGLTFIAFALDICADNSYSYSEYTSSCSQTSRLDNGAVSMIFGTIFFVAAGVTTMVYAMMIRNGRLPRDADQDEKTHVARPGEEDQLLTHRVVAASHGMQAPSFVAQQQQLQQPPIVPQQQQVQQAKQLYPEEV